MIVTMSSVLNESFRQLRHPVDFPFSFSLLCVCVVIADISCSAVAAASIRHASTFVSLIASVCISIKPFSCPHTYTLIYVSVCGAAVNQSLELKVY